MCPYWTFDQEKVLMKMFEEGKSVEEIAKRFQRSKEAVILKAKRLGLDVEKCLAKTIEKKDSFSATTTTPKLEPIKFEELPSPNDAMGLLWAAICRLQEPDVSREEGKKLRLILQGVKSYIHLDADYVKRIRHVETAMLIQNKYVATQLKLLIDQATTPEEKAKLEKQLAETAQSIKEFLESGVREPKTAKET